MDDLENLMLLQDLESCLHSQPLQLQKTWKSYQCNSLNNCWPKRLSIEETELGKGTLKIDTIVAYPADAVGPVVYLELVIEGYPVKAVVDSGAQSTFLFLGLLYQQRQWKTFQIEHMLGGVGGMLPRENFAN